MIFAPCPPKHYAPCQEAAWRDIERFAQWGDLPGFRSATLALPVGACDPASGWGPVDFAVFHGHEALMNWWVQDFGQHCPSWRKGLLFKALAGRSGEALIRALIKAGCSVDETNEKGQCALHVAAWLGNGPAVPLLLAAGANWRIRDHGAMSPLRWAVRGGHLDCVEAFLSWGVDPFWQDARGLSDLDFALVSGQPEVIARLMPYVDHRTLHLALPDQSAGEGGTRRL